MELVLVFENTHYAIMGEKLLLNSEIRVRVMPLPGEIKSGCGLCLRLGEGDYQKGLSALEKGKVPVAAVYSKRKLGNKAQYELYQFKL